MSYVIRESVASGLFVLLATYIVFVQGRTVWSRISAQVGEPAALLGLVSVCVLLGAVFSAVSTVPLPHFVAGGFVVYTLWWFYLEATAGPFDSPVHIYLGAVFLISFSLGAGLVGMIDRGAIEMIPSR